MFADKMNLGQFTVSLGLRPVIKKEPVQAHLLIVILILP